MRIQWEEIREKNVQSQPVVRRKVADVAAMQANATRRKSLAIVVCFACFPCVLKKREGVKESVVVLV